MPDWNVWITTGGTMEQPEWRNEYAERIEADDPDQAVRRWLLRHPKFKDPQYLNEGKGGRGWSFWGWTIRVERANEPGRLMLSDMTDDELRFTITRLELELRNRHKLRARLIREGRLQYKLTELDPDTMRPKKPQEQVDVEVEKLYPEGD